MDNAKTRLQKIQPYYDDLTKSYDDYTKVEHSNYNTCYKHCLMIMKLSLKKIMTGMYNFPDNIILISI